MLNCWLYENGTLTVHQLQHPIFVAIVQPTGHQKCQLSIHITARSLVQVVQRVVRQLVHAERIVATVPNNVEHQYRERPTRITENSVDLRAVEHIELDVC